jgi:hypothetical protein
MTGITTRRNVVRRASATRAAKCAAAAVLTLAVAGVWTRGEASDRAASDLKTACLATHADTDQRDSLEQLKDLDTSDARKTLEEIASGKDTTAAALALLTIGRADYSGARSKLASVFEDTKRPHAVRAAAFQGWARAEAADGTSWESIESYAKANTKEGSPLRDSALATRAVLFPATGK